MGFHKSDTKVSPWHWQGQSVGDSRLGTGCRVSSVSKRSACVVGPRTWARPVRKAADLEEQVCVRLLHSSTCPTAQPSLQTANLGAASPMRSHRFYPVPHYWMIQVSHSLNLDRPSHSLPLQPMMHARLQIWLFILDMSVDVVYSGASFERRCCHVTRYFPHPDSWIPPRQSLQHPEIHGGWKSAAHGWLAVGYRMSPLPWLRIRPILLG